MDERIATQETESLPLNLNPNNHHGKHCRLVPSVLQHANYQPPFLGGGVAFDGGGDL